MSANKKIVIAGIDAEDWLNIESEGIATVEFVDRRYEQKIIAFLDLLGMKDLILNKKRQPGEESEAFDTIEQIKKIVEIETKSLDKDNEFVLLQLSDSFIFTCSDDDILHLIKLLATIQMRILVECKFLLRGAITYGDIYVAEEGKQIIGPAYIDAYLLQENHAIYPRIILSNAFLDRMSELNLDSAGIMLAADTERYIDYVGLYLETQRKPSAAIITHLKRLHVFNYLVANFNEFNSKNKNTVKQKYGWTVQYFKSKGVWPNDKQYNNW